MSGGVDSSVAAALMVEAGYEVIGVTLNVEPREIALETIAREDACCSITSVEDARRVASHLGIAHYALNFRDVFRERVIDDFSREYTRGRTPNPCVRCNEYIKFEAVLDRLTALDADVIATGHYARGDTCQVTGRPRLLRGADSWKDQSYVLYPIKTDLLARVVFPLGGMTKAEARQAARARGLLTADKPESQDICFVPDGDYGAHVARQYGAAARPGAIRDTDGRVIGEHRGIVYYTIGQRRGLGIAATEPRFVIRIDADANEVIVGVADDLLATTFSVSAVNWVSIERPSDVLRAETKIRSRSAVAASEVWPGGDGGAFVRFSSPQRAITPGQAAVFYQGDIVLGGGTIECVDPLAHAAVTRDAEFASVGAR
ncbi:MAG: tRNA 2-thiouridine(34) synthase MnmA [Chloroflexota bacterium]|nr:MAG: tRNA 2-thiouridine(34) synthase MnmA [Chloroflexota bacterium]